VSSLRDSIRDSNGGAYLLLFLSFIFFSGVGGLLMMAFGFHVTAVAAQIVGVLGAALLWRWVMGDAAAAWPSFRPRVGLGALIVVVLAAVVLGFLANAVASLLVELSPAMRQIAESYTERMSELILEATGPERVLGIIGVCVAAPICEELLFRGTILQEQRKVEAVATAAIVNGIGFSLFHLNIVSFVGLVLIGIFLAHITIRSGSIVPAIVAHASINTANAVVLPALVPEAADLDAPLELGGILAAVAILGVATAFLWWAALRLMPPVDEVTGDKPRGQA
jgi:uncharacterized protein